MTGITWSGNAGLTLRFDWSDISPVRLTSVGTSARELDGTTRRPVQPLVEVLTPALGRTIHAPRFEGTKLGRELRFVSSSSEIEGTLRIVQRHEETGLVVVSNFVSYPAGPAIQTWTELSLESGRSELVVFSVSSFATGAFVFGSINDIDVWKASSSWGAENRWGVTPLRAPGQVQVEPLGRGETSRGSVEAVGRGAYSSGVNNPIGVLQDRPSGKSFAWQVHTTGAWHWEAGELPDWNAGTVPIERRVMHSSAAGPATLDATNDGAYLSISGPTDAADQWSVRISTDESFSTIPIVFAIGDDLEHALGALTSYRRATRRPHWQNVAMPVVFNDYMNTLMGDPTEAKLTPLITSAAAVGAEIFCVDAGWYDDTAGWWASVGDWNPSAARFPSGIEATIAHIVDSGMVAGLWMEPEVVGATSAAARELPENAFMHRSGVRVREHDRYFLDFSQPEARAHVRAAVDRLINRYGIGYFKFDFNVTPGAGTDTNGSSAGMGLLSHNRAFLAWLEDLLDDHPDLIIENCASGAMRSDFSILQLLQLQSTSDQTDPRFYPYIAVGAVAHILPEQAANWSYPQPDMSDEMIIFTMCTGLAGRLYLSGVLHLMDEHRENLVRLGVATHKAIRSSIGQSTPGFPTGLPAWGDPWTSVAFVTASHTHVVVWRQEDAPSSVNLSFATPISAIEQIYPPVGTANPWGYVIAPGGIEITSSAGLGARLFRLTHS